MPHQPLIDGLEFATAGARQQGRWPVRELPRLLDMLASETGEIAYELEGTRDERGRPGLRLSLRGTLQLVVHKRLGLTFPRAVTPTHHITMGFDPDLDDAARQALRDMIAWLVQLKGWTPEEAYVFCSLACDLRVTQLVDGNKGIHAMVSRELLGR